MKKLYFFLAALALNGQMNAKPVNVATAKLVGFNYLSSRMNSDELQKADDLQLVYTAASTGAQSVNYYFVFNAGKAGFVMVSADDQVIPVFGYSTEGAYAANNVPPAAVGYFKHYADEIQYAIEHNIAASDETAAEWKMLLSGKASGAQKTTAVTPLVTTKWNQDPYYNALCPTQGSQNAVTGCVATAMAQVMKFWNFPIKGTGTKTYTPSGFATQTANFAATTYNWTAMPAQLTSTSSSTAVSAVATLMLHAGISVEMMYGLNSSGAYVSNSSSPVSAENALKQYFGYSSTLTSIYRSNIGSAWVQTIKDELDNGQPVMYAGYTPSFSGHVWVVDGYDASSNFHVNWGWGGMADGYYAAGNMTPGSTGTGGASGGFNQNEHAIIGITPPSSIPSDAYEPNNTTTQTYNLGLKMTGASSTVAADASIHMGSDKDYYFILLPAGTAQYKIFPRLHDAANSTNGKTYTLDAQFASSSTQVIWSAENDVAPAAPLTGTGGNKVYFRVTPKTAGKTGTYFFEVKVVDILLGVEETVSLNPLTVYPNPASSMLHVDFNGTKATDLSIIDVQGRVVKTVNVADHTSYDLNVEALANGNYFLRIDAGNGVVTKQITINK